MECESTPIMLWMSSNKRYIWYFTLHYGNLLSKQAAPASRNTKTPKELAEGGNQTARQRKPHSSNLVRRDDGDNNRFWCKAVNCCGLGGKRGANLDSIEGA